MLETSPAEGKPKIYFVQDVPILLLGMHKYPVS